MKYHIMMKQLISNSRNAIRVLLICTFCIFFSIKSNGQGTVDIGVYSLVAPLAPHIGANKSVTVKVRNYGKVAITSLKIVWKIDGEVQPTFSSTVSLPASSPANQISTSNITLSTSFLDVAGKNFEFYTIEANGQTDVDASNDTLRAYTATPIAGTKIVGVGTAHYRTIADAFNAIRYSGISNDLTIKVKPGSYFEPLELPAIDYNNSIIPTKNVIVESQSGARDVFIITPSLSQASIKLDGADRVTLRNLKIVNRNIVSGIGVQLLNNANYNTITNCDISVDSISNGKGFAGILLAEMGSSPYNLMAKNTGKYTTITNNVISGGYYGIAISSAALPRDTGIVIENNTINQVSFYGINVNNLTNLKLKKNKVYLRPSADLKSAGYYLTNVNTFAPGNIEITFNYVTGAGQYGIYMSAVTGTGTPFRAVNLSNNMIAGGFFSNKTAIPDWPHGLSINSCGWLNVYFNSVRMDAPTNVGVPDNTVACYVSGSGSSTNNPLRIFNNIFYNANNGYAIYNAAAALSNPIVAINNNDYFVAKLDPNTNPVSGFTYWNSMPRTNLSDLVAVSGMDLQSISKDPFFFSPTDLHSLSSDIDQKGSTVPLTEVSLDYDNEPRDQDFPPDIGCDEFGPGGEDFAIIGITPDVFKYKKPTPWKIFVRYQGPNSGTNKKLYFKCKIDGVDPFPDSVIAYTFKKLSNYFTVEDLTVPIWAYINRNSYKNFKFTVYFASVPNGDTRPLNNSLTIDVCVGLDGRFLIDKNKTPNDSTFTSLQQTYELLKCGVAGPTTIELADGVYNDQMYLWKIRNSNAVNTITFKSLNNAFDSKLIYSEGTSENHATVLMNNAQYIILEELTIENQSLINGSCVQLAGNAKYNTIKNCVLRLDSTQTPYPNSLVGIVSSKLGTLMTTPACYGINSSYNTITGNKIFGGHFGIAMYGFDTAQRDLGNVISKNIIASFNQTGVYLEYADTKVLNNVITGRFGMSSTANGIDARWLGDRAGVFSNEISGNKIYDITSQGITLKNILSKKIGLAKKSSFVIANNMIAGGFTTPGASTCGIFLSNSLGVSIINNTVLMDAPRDATNSSTNVPRCMSIGKSNTDIEAINNILYSTYGAIPLEYYTKFDKGGKAPENGLIYSENNLYYTSFPEKKTQLTLIKRLSDGDNNKLPVLSDYSFSQKSATPQTALSSFKNAAGNSTRDRKSLALPVKFENLPYDLHTYDPNVESKGSYFEVKTDFDLEPRKSKTPDIGCDEFTIPFYDLDISQIRNPLLSACKPNTLSVRLRNRGKYSLEGRSVILTYSVIGEGYSASGRDTVKLTMKAIGSEQIYNFRKPFVITDYSTYQVCVDLISESLKVDTIYINNTRCADLGVGIGGDYYVGFLTKLPNTDTTRYFKNLKGAIDDISKRTGIACETFIYMDPVSSPYLERVIIPKYLVALDSPYLNILPHSTLKNTDVVLQQPATPVGDDSKLHYTLRLQSSNFVRIKNLNIKNTGANFGSGIHITRNAQSIVIDGCKVEVNSTLKTKVFCPIAFTSTNKLDITDPVSCSKNGSNIKIVRNELVGGYAGVALIGASQLDNDFNNIIDSNNIRDFYQHGIYSSFNTIKSFSYNSLIPRSTADSSVSVLYKYAGPGGKINANKIIDSKLNGIKLDNVVAFDDNMLIVSNNWFTNYFGSSIAKDAGAILIKGSSNIGLYYNSIKYDGKRAAINIASGYYLSLNENLITYDTIPVYPYSIQVYNNIIKVDSISGDNQTPYSIYFDSNDPFTNFEHNDYHTDYASKFAYYRPDDQESFSEWQLNTSKDFTSFNLNPEFISNTDLNLSDSLKFDKKGLPVKGITRDFNNRKRSPRITDIGSIEYERELNNVSLWNIVNEKAVYGSNTFKVTVLNEGNLNLSDKSICLEYSVDSGLTWQGNQTVQLNELKGRYDEQVVSFNLKHLKKDFLVIPLCVRIVPTDDICRLPLDTIRQYETICKDLCVGLEKGIYTIGKNGTEDFSNFSQAIVALTCGFDSSIVFNISPGTYTERFSIPPIKTTKDTTVTFTSATGNKKEVILQFSNTGIQSEHHIAQVAGARYINFKYLTFKSAAVARASGIHLADSASYNTVDGCDFYLDSTSKNNTLTGVLGSGTFSYFEPSISKNNIIRNCNFYGGAVGVRFVGPKDVAINGPNQVVNCKFNNNYTAGIDIFYSQIDSISKNRINMRKGNPLSTGINVYGALTDFIITENWVTNAGNASFMMDSCRTISRGLIANNMFAGGNLSDGKYGDQSMAIRNTGAFPLKNIPSSGSIDIINNSLLYDGDSDSSAAFRIYNSNSMNISNNIFSNKGKGYALDYTGSDDDFIMVSSNVLNSKDSNLVSWNGIKYKDINTLSYVKPIPAFGAINSFQFDPLYRTNLDLHVNLDSLDGKGLISPVVTVDIDGEPRIGLADIGADQFIPGFDVEMNAIIKPLQNASFKDSVLVWVRVKNVGSVYLNSFKVKYKLDEKLIDSFVVTIEMKPDTSVNIIFKKKFSTRVGGKHILTAYTEIQKTDELGNIVNNDFNNLNDTIRYTLYSKDTSDIGVSQFITPLNNLPLKQITPAKVRVLNYGNLTAYGYKATLVVNGKIKEVKQIPTQLKMNQINDVDFNYQIDPDSAVIFEICSYTSLNDDVIPENDSTCIVVSTVTGLDANNISAYFSAYPNPSNSKINFVMYQDKPNALDLTIYDIMGRKVYFKKYEGLSEGFVKVNTDLTDFAEGTYLYVLKSGQKYHNGRFVKINQ
jgi:hypothetical protein